MTLEEARSAIDRIDGEMARLFEERMQAVDEVIAYKQAHHLPILDVGREAQVIEKNRQRIRNPVYEASYVCFLKAVMAVSRAYQAGKRGGKA